MQLPTRSLRYTLQTRFTTSVSTSQPKPQQLRPPHLGCLTSQRLPLQGGRHLLPLPQQPDHQLPPLSPQPRPLLWLHQSRLRDNIMFSRQRARAKKGRWARWRRWRRSRSTSSLELLSLSQLSSQFSPSFFAIRSFLTEFNLHYYVLLTCILLLSSLLNHPLSSFKSRAGSNFDKQPGAQLAAFNFLQG